MAYSGLQIILSTHRLSVNTKYQNVISKVEKGFTIQLRESLCKLGLSFQNLCTRLITSVLCYYP